MDDLNQPTEEKKLYKANLEKLIHKGYDFTRFVYRINTILRDEYYNYLNLRQEYKTLIKNTDFDIAKQYVERFWPANNRSKEQDKYMIIELLANNKSKNHSSKKINKRFVCLTTAFADNYLKLSNDEINQLTDKVPTDTILTLLNNDLLPVDKILSIPSEIKNVNKNYLSQDKNKHTDSEIIDKDRYIYRCIIANTAELYAYIDNILTRLGKSLLKNDNIETNKYNIILTQLYYNENQHYYKKLKAFIPVQNIILHPEKLKQQKITSGLRLDIVYSNNSEISLSIDSKTKTAQKWEQIKRIFNEEEIKIISSLDKSIGKTNQLKHIVGDALFIDIIQQNILIDIETAWEKIIPIDDQKQNKSIFIEDKFIGIEEYKKNSNKNIIHLNKIIDEYESTLDTRSTRMDFALIDLGLKDFLIPSKEYFKNWIKNIRVDSQIYQTMNLKILRFIKQQISKKPEYMALTDKIKKLESTISMEINKTRSKIYGELEKNNQSIMFSTIRTCDFGDRKDILYGLYNLQIYTGKYRLSYKQRDCLDPNGKFESQGISLMNNRYSTILLMQLGKIIKVDLKNSPTNMLPVKISSTLGRAFLYDAKIDREKGLFVAGFSGNSDLNNFKNWQEHVLDSIYTFAKVNNYNKMFFNINPIGDIRNPDTRFSHEFVRTIVDECKISEAEYHFNKQGSGRKPQFFELTREAKEKYTQRIEVTRDPDLIGTFFVEGMFGTREEAINSKISLNPEKEHFTPYFFEKEGYAPIITYNIGISHERL